MTTFFLASNSRAPSEATRTALHSLGFPNRLPIKSFNQIGHRLDALLRPEGRGKLSMELVQRFLEAVVARMAGRGKAWKQLSDEEILEEIGIRKMIIAAGKSTRFSPALARKQLAKADSFSSVLLHTRQGVGIHCCSDVIVIDPGLACRFLQQPMIGDMVSRRQILNRKIRPEISDCVKECCKSGRNIIEVYREVSIFLKERFSARPAQLNDLLDELGYTLFRPFIETQEHSPVPNSQFPSLGHDIILAVARSRGPGEAFMEGLRRLKDLGLAEQTRYVMPVYSDYAPALLPSYPPIYLQAYMEAVTSPDSVITVGAKSPLDEVEDRGNIVLSDGPEGPVPEAIREWRDMNKREQQEARRRLEESRRTGTPQHGLNAGIFVIDRAWSFRQKTRIRREYNHPDPEKGKLKEYWYTDLVELAARQKKSRKVVILGEEAPSGCKNVSRLLKFGEQMIESIRPILLALNIRLDATARVRIRSQSPSFSLESAAKKIFGERPDSVHLFGDIFLEDTVRIGDGVVLDGRGRPIQLGGNTYLGMGVGLIGSAAMDAYFSDNRIDGVVYEPPEGSVLNTLTEIIFSEVIGSYIASGISIQHARILDSFIQSTVRDSDVNLSLVVPDETIQGKTISPLPFHELATGTALGAFSISELKPKDKKGVLAFIRMETEKLFQEKMEDEQAKRVALSATDFLWKQEKLLGYQSSESLYRHAFGWLRKERDPFHEEKQSELDALRPLADESFSRLLDHDFSDIESTRALLCDLTLLATKANLFDWQSPVVRELSQKSEVRDQRSESTIHHLLSTIPSSLAIDSYSDYEAMVFDSPAPSDFLYLTDNTGEALFDALVWFALCQLGHRVIVAAKEKPAGGDATVEDVLSMIDERPELRRYFDSRSLRVISNGNDTYGTFLHRAPEEFRVVYHSPTLRAIIGKGQANLYTTVARNRLNAPYVAQFLVKGITAERLTGIRTLRRDGKKIPRPIVAVVPPGHCITEQAPGTKGARTLKQFIKNG